MAKAKKTARAAKPRGSGRLIILVPVLIGCATLFPGAAAILFAGLIPTYVAWVIDGRPNRLFTLTVLMPNFVGALAIILMLWEREPSFDRALALLMDPTNMLIILVASGIGWALAYTVPPIASQWAKAQIQVRVKRLGEAQAQIKEIWGDAVAESEAAALEAPSGDQEGA